MISEKRSEAARANGARSRGPITPEGKAISSRNAMRHGLLAATIVLSNEDAAGFETLFNMFVARFSPVDDVEMSMIEEMAASYWRLRRAWAIEHSVIEAGLRNQPPAAKVDQTAGAFCEVVDNGRLALLNRYETRLQNMYQRAIRSLALLRRLPAQQPEPEPDAPVPNEPKTPSVCNTETAPPAAAEPPEPPFSPGSSPVELNQFEIVTFDPLRFP